MIHVGVLTRLFNIITGKFTRESKRLQRARFRVEPLEERQMLAADFSLQVLHASDLEGGIDAIDNAANFAAVVEGLEESAAVAGTPSILLSAGDNYIPGPFFSAGGDSSLRSTLSDIYLELYGQNPAVNPDVSGFFDWDIREGSGRIDITIMNTLGFDAAAVGNHEFDLGSDAFESIIEEDIRDSFNSDGLSDEVRWLGAQFPYLSANLDFSADGDLSNLVAPTILDSTQFGVSQGEFDAIITASTSGNAADLDAALDAVNKPKLAQATVIQRDGELIGVVGATTQLISSISSSSGTVDGTGGVEDMDALAAAIQPVIDDLTNPLGLGVNKVILVSHLQQISLEQSLATKLDNVDIIIAGGSDSILANVDDTLRPGDTAANSYPIVTSDLDGDPTLIVSTAGEYSYVGQLTVDFDATGILIDGAGNPVDAVADLDLTKNGPVATTDASVISIWGNLTDPFAAGTKGEKVQRLVNAVTTVVNTTDGNVFGETDVFIDGRRESVRTQETNMGNMTADANLFAAKQFDPTVEISIKNGGGIRAPIGEIDGFTGELLPPQGNPAAGKAVGEISQLDIENTLRFNNGLTLLTVSSDELKILLEHAVAATGPGQTPGQFAQVGGLRFSFDPDGTPIQFNSDVAIGGGAPLVAQAGTRVQNVALIDDNGDVTEVLVENGVVVNPSRQIRMVTLDFMFGIFSSSPNFGGDSYPFPAVADNVVQLKSQGLGAGDATFAGPGTEQDAFAEYLVATFPADVFDPGDAKPAFGANEVRPELDSRIQNLNERADTVIPFDGKKVVVTNGLDFGEGSFRNAVHIANNNPIVKKIVIKSNVDLITLDSAVEYVGAQDLTIKGNDSVILASDVFSGTGVFVSSGAADLKFKDLTIDGDFESGETAANGIFVPVPADATGQLSVVLDDVTIMNSGLFGLHIADQINNSPASIKLVMKNSSVENNGIGALDFDGVRVDEGGDGSITAKIKDTSIDANGGDGLELDERGDGHVSMQVKDSTFNDNGFFDVEDLDDGLDIDEAGPGSIFATLEDVDLSGNLDEGLDLDEEDAGGVTLDLEDVTASNNLDEGIKISEEDDGWIVAKLKDVRTVGNGDDGIEFEESGDGSVFVDLEDVVTRNNGDEGIQVEETGLGSLFARLKNIDSRNNAGSGAQFTEDDGGHLFVWIEESSFVSNLGFGITAEQQAPGSGILVIEDVVLASNTEGPLELDGVTLLSDDDDD